MAGIRRAGLSARTGSEGRQGRPARRARDPGRGGRLGGPRTRAPGAGGLRDHPGHQACAARGHRAGGRPAGVPGAGRGGQGGRPARRRRVAAGAGRRRQDRGLRRGSHVPSGGQGAVAPPAAEAAGAASAGRRRGGAGRRCGAGQIRRPAGRPRTVAALCGRRRPGRAAARAAHPGPARRGPTASRPWPAGARDAFTALLGAGQAAVGVWEALDQEGLINALLPDWERVRNRPQRNPLHKHTVDRHLVETAARAAALTREVGRPDLLLLAAFLHDIGKGWPGDHSVGGEVVARDVAHRAGFGEADAELVASAVRHHLLLPQTAVRRDLDDPVTVARVAGIVGSRALLGLLHALAIADGQATGPAAWSDWKASLVAELVDRVSAELSGEPAPFPELPRRLAALAAAGAPEALVSGGEVTVAGPAGHGLLWQAAGVLASHRLVVRSANVFTQDGMAVTVLRVAPEFGDPPDAGAVAGDLRRMLAGLLDVTERLRRRAAASSGRSPAVPGVPPPKVTLVDDASRTATVGEIRAHDEPGLLWRMGRALGECGLDVRAARVETLGAEAVDVFYVVDGSGGPVTDLHLRGRVAARVLEALTG